MLIIPFGNNCAVAYQLQKYNLRIHSYPFDWLSCNNISILDLISNDYKNLFEDLIIKKKLDFHYKINSYWNDSKLNTVNVYNSQYKIFFKHDFLEKDFSNNNFINNVKEKYERRIERFNTIMQSEKKKILIQINNINLYDEYVKLFEKKNYKNYKLIIILNNNINCKNWKLDEINWFNLLSNLKIYTDESCRNKIICDNNNFCNDYIKKVIFQNNLNLKNTLISVSNLNNYYIKDKYLEKNNLYKNKYFFEIIFDKIIIRHYNTFHQNDDNIRKYLYINLYKLIKKSKKILFIGGEIYIFGVIFYHLYSEAYFISDNLSIIKDTIINNIHNKKIQKIEYCDYKNYIIKDSYDLILCNVSKSGLTDNLCLQINNSNSDKLIIIYCSEKSIIKNLPLLFNFYLEKSIQISTNYSIYLLYLTNIKNCKFY